MSWPSYFIANVDCVEDMKWLPSNGIDLTVTSPPYDNLRAYDGYTFDYKAVLDGLFRVTRVGGVVVWVVADQTSNGTESGQSFRHALYAKK
jgi:site-specific DNA-methyltransferase (adenine-specific)